MKPWRDELPEDLDDDLELEASRLLTRGAEVPGWTAAEKRAVWRRLASSLRVNPATSKQSAWRRSGPRVVWRGPLALAASTALLVFALIRGRSPASPPISERPSVTVPAAVPSAATAAQDWTSVDLGRVGKLRVQSKASYRLPTTRVTAPPLGSEYRIALDEGTLCAEVAHRDLAVEGPLLVETPQMQVVVIGTRFCVEAHGGISTVSVTEGRVRVQTGTGSVLVGAGEKLGSDDARLRATTLAPVVASEAAPAVGRTYHPAAQRVAVAEQPFVPPAPPVAIPPSSLAEQNAIYAVATAARDRHDGPAALTAWRAYLSRFPVGVLAPDASAGVLGELVSEGRDSEALLAADDYLGRFPADGRAAEVAFIRGNLLHDKQGRIADALAAYRQALALTTRPALRDDALFAVGVCERLIGHVAQAQETFRQYQSEFPNGAHAGELSRWVSQ